MPLWQIKGLSNKQMKTLKVELQGKIVTDGEYFSVVDDKGELVAEYDNMLEADLHLMTLGSEDEYKANYQECGYDDIAHEDKN